MDPFLTPPEVLVKSYLNSYQRCGSLPVCNPSGTVTRRGSKGDCPARSSTAHLAVLIGTR